MVCNAILFFIFPLLSIITIGYCYDIIKSIRSPLEPQSVRIRNIYIFAFVYQICILTYILLCLLATPDQSKKTLYQTLEGIGVIYFIRENVQLVFCVYSLKVAYSGLIKRQGSNQQIQRDHFMSQFMFCLVATLFTL